MTFRRPDALGVRTSGKKTGVKQSGNILARGRAIANAALGRLDLKKRL
jgi:hypothetical protein